MEVSVIEFTTNLVTEIIAINIPIDVEPFSIQPNAITSKYNGTSSILIAFIIFCNLY